MELLKLLANLKIKSFFMTFMFLFTITIPGILILFHFFPKVFFHTDILRLFMFIISIGVAVLLVSIVLSSAVIVIISIINSDDEIFENENSYLEVVFMMGAQLALLFIFFLFVIFYFSENSNILNFLLWFVICEIIYSIFTVWGLVQINKELRENNIKELGAKKQAEEDKIKKIELLIDEIYTLKNNLRIYINQRKNISSFQLFRSAREKERQMQDIENKINQVKATMKEKKEEMKKLINNE